MNPLKANHYNLQMSLNICHPQTSQIAKTLRYRSDIFASDRYLLDIDPMAFITWDTNGVL